MPDEAAIDEETADDLINEFAGTVNNPLQYAGAVNVDVRKQFFLQQVLLSFCELIQYLLKCCWNRFFYELLSAKG